jgi:hypothetical protein
MRYLTPVFAAALILAAPSAHAFTFGNATQSSSGGAGWTSTPGSSLTNPSGVPGSLATPEDQVKNFGGGTDGQQGGLNLRFGGANSNNRLSTPSWSNNPLYLDKAQ